jgi:hypothetical protein
MIQFETDGYGTHPIDWVDQIWVSPTLDQAMFIKFDLKPDDESLLGKSIPMEHAFLFHGKQDNGVYFAAYFDGFDEKSAKEYFQKISHAKNQTAFHGLKTIFTIPSAYAEQTSPCGTKATGVVKGLYSIVKNNKWACVKSFIKNAFGGIVSAAANAVLGVLDGSIWTKVGKNWQYISTVFGALQKTSGSLKDLEFLPEKTRAEFVCESLGKGASSASGSFNSGLSGAALTDAVQKFIKQVTHELFNSAKYRKMIEENKNKQQAFCTKPSSKKDKSSVPGVNSGSESIGTNIKNSILGK